MDESGDENALVDYNSTPVLVLAGLVVQQHALKPLIRNFLGVKRSFAAQHVLSAGTRLSELVSYEIKGSDLRADVRKGRRRAVRRAFGILNKVMDLLELHDVNLIGYVHVKKHGCQQPAGRYPMAVARLAENFETELRERGVSGIMVLDARTKHKNVPSVQSITTRKFRANGDPLTHLVESPVFGHSDAHVVLQIADLVASAMLFPMACAAYCADIEDNAHPHDSYAEIRNRYGRRLRAREARHPDGSGMRRGGVVVFDDRNRRRSLDLFEPDAVPVLPTPRPEGAGIHVLDRDQPGLERDSDRDGRDRVETS